MWKRSRSATVRTGWDSHGFVTGRGTLASVEDVPTTAELRRALELAHTIARADFRRISGPTTPAGLLPFVESSVLPPAAHAAVRAVLEDDVEFRSRVAQLADEREVGLAAWLWLARPDGWRRQLDDLSARADVERLQQLESGLAAARAQADAARATAASLEARLADEQARHAAVERGLQEEVARRDGRIAELLDDLARRRRHSGELERRANAAEAQLGDSRAKVRELSERIDALTAPEPSRDEHEAGHSVDETDDGRTLRRRPRRSPNGLLDDSPAGFADLLKVPGVRVLLDGYNVTMLGWSGTELQHQRERLVARLGARLTGRTVVDVVFDGDDAVVPPSGVRTPASVRLVWSPSGVSADDVILRMVDAIDPAVAVVVVSNDREVLDGARERGANVVSSHAFLHWLG